MSSFITRTRLLGIKTGHGGGGGWGGAVDVTHQIPESFLSSFLYSIFLNDDIYVTLLLGYFLHVRTSWSLICKYEIQKDLWFLLFRIGRILRSKTREEVFTLCDKYDDNSQGQVLPYVFIQCNTRRLKITYQQKFFVIQASHLNEHLGTPRFLLYTFLQKSLEKSRRKISINVG